MCFSMKNTNMESQKPSKNFKSLDTWKYEQKSEFTDFTIFQTNNVLIDFEIFVTNSVRGMSFSMYFSMLNTNMRSTRALDWFEGLQNDKSFKKVIFKRILSIFQGLIFKRFHCFLIKITRVTHEFRCAFRWRAQIWSHRSHQKTSKALLRGNMSRSLDLPILPYFGRITF